MRKIFSKRVRCLSLVLVLLFSAAIFADKKTDKVDKIFAQWDTTVTPGCALAVIKDGEVIYKRGYGMAKLEDGIVMTPDKIFDIGSVSKQFTAACIAMLALEGKISLDEDIRKYLPEVPVYEKPITIQNLIHHTSGLRDYTELLDLAGYRAETDWTGAEEALEIISRQKKLNFLPGEEYSYSNTGYFLLGQIVERVSRKSLNEFAQERIFKPLGMSHTLYQDDHRQIIKNRATGYDQTEKGYELEMSTWDQTGDGNIYTSVEDLYLWDQAFYNYRLGKDLMDMLQKVGVLNNGKKLDYAFGLRIDEYKGLKIVEHSGAWAGFQAGFVRFPGQKFSVICLANLSSIEPSELCLRVADIYLADLLKEPPIKDEKGEAKRPIPVRLSRPELQEKVGSYQDERFGTWAVVSLKEDQLKIAVRDEELLLIPVAKAIFKAVDAPTDVTLEFLPEGEGKPKRAILREEDEETYFLKDESPAALSPDQIKEYAGDYLSAELLDATYRLVIEDGNLILKFRSFLKSPLKPMARDKFQAYCGNMDFVRGADNAITGFSLSVDRAAKIEFRKK